MSKPEFPYHRPRRRSKPDESVWLVLTITALIFGLCAGMLLGMFFL